MILLARVLALAGSVLTDAALPLPQQAAPDSAGVRVVASRPTDVPANSWRLASAPEVEIGVVEGRPEYLLDRVSNAAFLSNGNILLANGGTRELRFYDRSGRHVRSVGRQGGGPGEFESLSLAGVFAGDSVLTWDQVQRRITVFDSAGRLARTQVVPEALGPAPAGAGLLRDGRMVALEKDIPILSASGPTTGIVRPQATLVTVAADGAAATIGSFPDTELSIKERVSFGVVFGRSLQVRGRGDRIAVGNTDAYSIRVFSGSGQLLYVIRQTRQLPAVPREDFDRAKPATFPPSPVGANMRAAVEQMPLPAAFPAFGEFRFDGQANLWVQEFARDWDEQRTWQVFSPDGRLIGRLTVPKSHTVVDATQTHALVRVVDELGVQRVRVYRIEK